MKYDMKLQDYCFVLLFFLTRASAIDFVKFCCRL